MMIGEFSVIMHPLLAISREKKPLFTQNYKFTMHVECVMLPLCCHLKCVGLPVAIIFYAQTSDRFHFLRVLRMLK